jgi:hypothetical protein
MTSGSPYPYQPGQLPAGPEPAPARARNFAAACGVLIGSAIAGVIGGLIWSAVAPRAAYVVLSRGSADVVNPETTAFITSDASYCLIGVVGGLIIGIVSYRLAIRKYGPVPMAALLAGSVIAGLAARWVGQNLGLAKFNTALLTSHDGTILHPPPVLGVDASAILWPAVVFWPLGACIIPATLAFVAAVRDRQPSGRAQLR